MRNIDVVELLLDKGAKVSAVDKVSSGTMGPHAGLLSTSDSWLLYHASRKETRLSTSPFVDGAGA